MGLASKIKNSNSGTPQSSLQPPSSSGSAPGYDYPPPPGASAPLKYPQHAGQTHGAPSAPPDPQQYYGAAYASPYPSQRVQSTPSAPSLYGFEGQTPPYGGQGQGQAPPYASQGHSLPYGEQMHTGSQPSYAYGGKGQGHRLPYEEQVTAGVLPSYAYGGQGQGHNIPPKDKVTAPSSYGYGDQLNSGAPSSYAYGQQMQAGAPPSYGQPSGGGFGPAQYQQGSYQQGAGINTSMLTQKLQSIIQANGLQSFYDPGRFQATVQKVASINFAEIAAQWRISKELAYDLAPLALYDIVFYCDDSGSMAFEENGERINDLKFILSKVSGIATLFDDDGIIVRFMNSDVNGDGIRNAVDVANLISKVRFSGATPLGTNFDRKIIQPFVIRQAMSNMAKPVLAIAITDGEPSGEDRGTIRQVISRAKDALNQTRYGGGAFAVQIAQVGKDAKTQQFLESLDADPVVGKMIDCTSYYELEEAEFARKGVTLTPELWLLKMCVGAIDPEYDTKDT